MTEYTPGPWGLFDGTDIWPINRCYWHKARAAIAAAEGVE